MLKVFLSRNKQDSDDDTLNEEGSGSGAGEPDDNEEGDVIDPGATAVETTYNTNIGVEHTNTKTTG